MPNTEKPSKNGLTYKENVLSPITRRQRKPGPGLIKNSMLLGFSSPNMADLPSGLSLPVLSSSVSHCLHSNSSKAGKPESQALVL